MTLRDFKKILNGLSEKELDQQLLYSSETQSLSGVVESIEKAKTDLYYLGEDDPAPLYTKKELRDEYGMDTEEISELEVEIPKGSWLITF